MDINDLKEKLLEARNKGEILFLKNAFPITPNWQSFVDLIEYADSDEWQSSGIREESLGVNTDLYYRIADVIDPVNKKNIKGIMPGLDDLVYFCDQIFDKECLFGEAYFNLKSRRKPEQPHNDPWDAVVWTCVGQIEFRIYSQSWPIPSDFEYKTYISNPGDIVIIPQGLHHNVIPLKPRASISLGYINDLNMQRHN